MYLKPSQPKSVHLSQSSFNVIHSLSLEWKKIWFKRACTLQMLKSCTRIIVQVFFYIETANNSHYRTNYEMWTKVSVRHAYDVSVRHGSFFSVLPSKWQLTQNTLLHYNLYTVRHLKEILAYIWQKKQHRNFYNCAHTSNPLSKMCPSVTVTKFSELSIWMTF